MSPPPTQADARQSLNAHVAAKGGEIHGKYGPHLGWSELLRLLEDPACVRYPCDIVFGDGPLQTGEMAFPEPKGARPEDGFTIYVHPCFATQRERVPALVLYQLVVVNYGAFASADDAETFGAAALGLSLDDYYRALCDLADVMGQPHGRPAAVTPHSASTHPNVHPYLDTAPTQA
ncbi:MAG: hypothetical protein ABSC03_02005 [Verrucomicrobiota bacterium]|jgi:hypothetical protein